ncbi:MAG TPA: hypothetical protein VJ596_06705 [Gemmatimonadaceae bacterium]|nr:hypothetical protein [Gemmatimonadaceae bacterium]
MQHGLQPHAPVHLNGACTTDQAIRAHPFVAMASAFARAHERCGNAGVVTHHFLFGGRATRLRVLGDILARELVRPLAHLRAAGDDISPTTLTIDLWDGTEIGEPAPRPQVGDDGWLAWPAGDGRFLSSGDGRFICYETESAITWLDRRTGRVVGWRADGARLSVHERTRPIPFILPLALQDHGLQLIHAGLVSVDGRGVLFAGNNGAGKSTCSLLCLCAGLEFLSDDHVALQEMDDGGFVGHSIYASTRLEPHHLPRFPLLAPHGIPSDHPSETKSLVQLAEVFPAQMKRSVGIRALVLPRIVGGSGARLSTVSRAEALRTLAPSSLLMLPFMPARAGFDKLVRLVEAVPSYRLEMGLDMAVVPARVIELADSLDAA